MFTLNQPVLVIIESLTRRSLWSLMHAVDHRERDNALAVEFNGRQGDVVDGDRLLSIRHFSVPAHDSLRCGSSGKGIQWVTSQSPLNTKSSGAFRSRSRPLFSP